MSEYFKCSRCGVDDVRDILCGNCGSADVQHVDSIELDTLRAQVEELKAALESEKKAHRLTYEAATDFHVMPCGHSSMWAYTEDGGKHIVCLLCIRDRATRAESALSEQSMNIVTMTHLHDGLRRSNEMLAERADKAEAELAKLQKREDLLERTLDDKWRTRKYIVCREYQFVDMCAMMWSLMDWNDDLQAELAKVRESSALLVGEEIQRAQQAEAGRDEARAKCERLCESLGWAIQLIDSVCGVGDKDLTCFDEACAALAECGEG